MIDYKRRESDLAVKQRAADGSTGSGYCAAFHNVDSATEVIAPTAFDKALPQFLQDGFLAVSHSWEEPVGKPMDAKVDSYGLLVDWKIADTAKGLDVRKLLAGGYVRKMSIGYHVTKYEDLSAPELQTYWSKHGYLPTEQDRQRGSRGARLLLEIDPLYEASFVAVPANNAASVQSVKSEGADITVFSHWLRRECGLSNMQANRFIAQAKSVVYCGPSWRASLPPSPYDYDTKGPNHMNISSAEALRRANMARKVKEELNRELTAKSLQLIKETQRSIDHYNAKTRGNNYSPTTLEMVAENRRVMLPGMTRKMLEEMDPQTRWSLFRM